MVQINNLDTLLTILKQLDSKDSHYQLYGTIEEKGSSVSVLGAPNPNVKLCANIVVLSPIGELYFHESVKLNESSAVSEFKEKLSNLNITPADVKISNGTIIIE